MKKDRLSSEVFYWDAPSRALHKRDLFPLQIEIAGKRYVIPQWTLEHFKIADFPDIPRLYSEKKPIKIKPIIRFRNFNIQFETNAIPLHYDTVKHELIARFEKIPEEHRELLQYFSEALETGDMVNIDNVLRRVDMPVTPASTELKGGEPDPAFRKKRAMMTGLYLLLGTALIAYTLATLYKKFTQIEVDSAFVSAPIIQVKSPSQGYIDDVLMDKDNIIARGQPLLILDTAKTITSSGSKINLAQNQVSLLESLIKEKKYKFDQQLRIRQSKLKAAKRSLSAAVSSRNIKCQRRYQTQIDLQNPQKHRAQCNTAKVKVSSAQTKVASEKDALQLATQQGSDSSASMQVLRTKLEQAQLKLYALGEMSQKQHVQNNASKSKALRAKGFKSLQTLMSSASGTVINVIENQHQFVSEGQVIAIVQQENTAKQIDAYITQEQATQLKIGQRALATSPTLDEALELIITRIDYVENSLSTPNKELFHWSVDKDKKVKLTLKIIGSHALDLPFGLPVTLNIKKHSLLNKKMDSENLNHDEIAIQARSKAEKLSEDKALKESVPKKSLPSTKPDETQSSLHLDDVLFGVAYADEMSLSKVPSYCKHKTRLFPASFLDSFLSKATEDTSIKGVKWRRRVLKKAKNLLKKKPSPLSELHSSGIISAKNKALKQTRIALRDANDTVLLALAYELTKKTEYLHKAKQYLLAWANTYQQPSGHPIDETRLEGFLWGYDLLSCYFTWEEQKTINAWLKTLQQKKHEWKFGPSSSKNNLRTHQLKILLMLDRLLDDAESLAKDQQTLAEHAKNNLLKDGTSFDFKERDALHYHVYDLEPWLEIALLEPEYKVVVNRAYDFLIKQIQADNIHNQFKHSKQKIDAKRAKGGFEYAKKGGTYKVERITRSVIAHSTLNQSALAEDSALTYLSKDKIEQNIFFLARHDLWHF